MAQNTFALMTNLGRAKEAAAIANGTAVVITHIAIGDGTTVPSGGETTLYHEIARKAVSGHGTVVGASNVAYFDIFLEAGEGPYTIREAGLIDDDGDLIAIARYDPPISKPIPSSGQTVEGTIRLEVAFSNIANITIVVDPAFKVALQRLNRLPWLPVISMTLTAPPASPSVGDLYLIPIGATGAWSGQSGKIAEYTSAGWGIMTPPDGHGVSLPDGRVFEKVSGVYVEKLALDAQSGKWSFAVAAGTANALTATLTPAPAALVAGLTLRLKIAASNTGPATLNLNGIGAKPILQAAGSVLKQNDLVSGQVVDLIFDGVGFQVANLNPSLTRSRNILVYRNVGTTEWVVPEGVFSVRVCVWAGGGGGGGATSGGAGGGGGGGGYAEGIYNVLPGATIPITIGGGGAGGDATGSVGASGGASSFGTLLSATGGSGGRGWFSGTPNPGTGGAGGTGVGGLLNVEGGRAANGYLDILYGSGGGGSYTSAGTPMSVTGGTFRNFPGVGGGGGAKATGGAQGADGLIVIEF
ncbi:phage tail-collar fiber domain-containing protein [Brucella anthropi]|uniref:Phage-related tail fibre protein-like protein n=1 Tax=Brucella anthropi (strain ATCC 49188 / DSM 6882 / CCUG 24695 / JCM 21032 / LMG 3331 / NBRC 15819 / NCTC 12168 / Alc 37) TaxID=439375 RepID=A6X1A9_BRUA4|nr:phage tail protein [Brucella anthropi]ABS15013.1 phage-related tail fibre protein-like protein [Brucella anthropi ATCC 49188]KAB2783686.1 DUF2793 domain-containing protein [Brucella anthropi]QQC26501.1 phage tail protein [Brucella anthropi]SUA62669.1 Protein of uncharacterised function (DUF2793) [Brucella anthropi]